MVRGKGFAAALLLVLLLAPAAAAGSFARIENVRTGVVLPGGLFTVEFDVHNILNDNLRYVIVQAPTSADFSPVGGDSWSSGGELARNAVVRGSITMRADDDTVAGTYTLPFALTSESKTLSAATFSGSVVNSLQTLSTTENVYVLVDGEPELVVSQKSSSPALIEAGAAATMVFDIYNNGSEKAKDVVVLVGEPAGVDVSSASRKLVIGDVAARAHATFQVGFVADRMAGLESFVLPVSVEYGGEARSSDQLIFLKRAAELEIFSVDKPLVKGANEQRLGFEVRNSGNRAASNIRLALLSDYPLTPSGRSAFIKELAPGESAIAYFTIDVDSKGAVQGYPVQLSATYDEGAGKVNEIVDGEVKVVAGFPTGYLWLAGIAVLAGTAFLIRKRAGSKRKK